MRKLNFSWHTILNNTTSTRSDAAGGSLFRALKSITYEERVGDQWICEIRMPCSFTKGDGLAFTARCSGSRKTDAEQLACRRALATLLSTNPSAVLLRPTHWRCSTTQLIAGIAEILGQPAEHQPLAVPPARSSAYLPPEPSQEAHREQEILNILWACLESSRTGICDPSHLRRLPDGSQPWLQLDSLLPPGNVAILLGSPRGRVRGSPKA